MLKIFDDPTPHAMRSLRRQRQCFLGLTVDRGGAAYPLNITLPEWLFFYLDQRKAWSLWSLLPSPHPIQIFLIVDLGNDLVFVFIPRIMQ